MAQNPYYYNAAQQQGTSASTSSTANPFQQSNQQVLGQVQQPAQINILILCLFLSYSYAQLIAIFTRLVYCNIYIDIVYFFVSFSFLYFI